MNKSRRKSDRQPELSHYNQIIDCMGVSPISDISLGELVLDWFLDQSALAPLETLETMVGTSCLLFPQQKSQLRYLFFQIMHPLEEDGRAIWQTEKKRNSLPPCFVCMTGISTYDPTKRSRAGKTYHNYCETALRHQMRKRSQELAITLPTVVAPKIRQSHFAST